VVFLVDYALSAAADGGRTLQDCDAQMHAALGPLGTDDIKLDEQAETCSS
jgi:hypothetical protein